ncbi:MAG: hybrid sensor histidine kinase/response regulator [Gemmatimonas sp.]|nr:hybrid sensor histidine kinase/response regulator [Gemmatimonas sp.]
MRAQRRAAEADSARVLLQALRDSVVDQPEQVARVDSILAGLDDWERSFARPALSGETITRALAFEGTLAFDRMAHPFENLVSEARRLRVERFRTQAVVMWGAFVAAVAALTVAFIAVKRLTAGLRQKAAEAAERQRIVEEQATELEHQTQVLEEQAGQLEEQTAALEEKVAERDSTLTLLEETSRFLDSAIDGSPYGIAFYDRRLRFQRVNKALAVINGAPAEAHIGKTIEQMIPALAPIVRPILEQVLSSGKPASNMTIEGNTPAQPNATRRWVVTYYPIPGPQQSVVGVGCIVQDVTEQYQTEQQLRQAQKLEAVGRLAGGIAHDFNNVLTVIQSYAEVLSFELEERGEGREEVEAIRAAADRAAGLARQLLAFARRDVIIPRDVNVREVILGMQLILRRLVPATVELSLELDESPLVVRIDAGQLEQVVMNLAINAVDAMPNGGRLEVRTATGPVGDDGRPTMTLVVKDNGTGMTDEVRERLFEPFFTTKPAGRGTGLGLATSYAIVREAGGRIDVSSTPGAGSVFTVVLPQAEASSGLQKRRSTPVRGIDVAGGNERILLAEDEPAIRSALSRILRAAGYDVLEASNGGEALRLADSDSRDIHLLLSDVMMPGIGGKELVQRLAHSRPDTRVVLMSGYTDDAALRADLGAARYAFLQKPFTAREVLLAVRTALDAT